MAYLGVLLQDSLQPILSHTTPRGGLSWSQRTHTGHVKTKITQWCCSFSFQRTSLQDITHLARNHCLQQRNAVFLQQQPYLNRMSVWVLFFNSCIWLWGLNCLSGGFAVWVALVSIRCGSSRYFGVIQIPHIKCLSSKPTVVVHEEVPRATQQGNTLKC